MWVEDHVVGLNFLRQSKLIEEALIPKALVRPLISERQVQFG